MHFDQRTQRALREAGLETDEIAAASDRVAELVAADAEALSDFFAGDGPICSDMDTAHSASEIREHPTAGVDLYTHGADLRGYLSLDGWGVPVEGGRVLREGGDQSAVVELALGDTVNDRVRFARDREAL